MQKVPCDNVTVTRIMCLTRGLALPPPSAALWYFTLILFPRMRILFNFVWLYYSPTARAGENRGDWSELSNVNGHFEMCTFKRTSKPCSAVYALHRHFIVWWHLIWENLTHCYYWWTASFLVPKLMSYAPAIISSQWSDNISTSTSTWLNWCSNTVIQKQ